MSKIDGSTAYLGNVLEKLSQIPLKLEPIYAQNYHSRAVCVL